MTWLLPAFHFPTHAAKMGQRRFWKRKRAVQDYNISSQEWIKTEAAHTRARPLLGLQFPSVTCGGVWLSKVSHGPEELEIQRHISGFSFTFPAWIRLTLQALRFDGKVLAGWGDGLAASCEPHCQHMRDGSEVSWSFGSHQTLHLGTEAKSQKLMEDTMSLVFHICYSIMRHLCRPERLSQRPHLWMLPERMGERHSPRVWDGFYLAPVGPVLVGGQVHIAAEETA